MAWFVDPEELQRRWIQNRRDVAATFFDGDEDKAYDMLCALPYSEIPDWSNVIHVIEVYRRLAGLPSIDKLSN